jgi:hypothetical protein
LLSVAVGDRPTGRAMLIFTRVPRIEILGSPHAGSWIKPRNTPPLWPWTGLIHTRGGRYYLRLDAYAASWMVATLLVMRCYLFVSLGGGVQSYLYANRLGFFVA